MISVSTSAVPTVTVSGPGNGRVSWSSSSAGVGSTVIALRTTSTPMDRTVETKYARKFSAGPWPWRTSRSTRADASATRSSGATRPRNRVATAYAAGR